MGEWHPIESAPKDRPVDLWVAAYEYDSVLVENCRWDRAAVIPDWYRDGDDGQHMLAVKLIYHATHWKEAGAAEGPLQDGGPPIRARAYIGELATGWPAQMQARRAAYFEAIDRSEIEEELIHRGHNRGTYVVQGGKQ
jgi:hypothetical protein